MKNNKRQVVKLTEEQMKMVLESMVNEQTEIDEYGKKGKWKEVWNEEDQLLAMYNSLYGIEELGVTKEEIANRIIGSSVAAFNQQSSNFDYLDGRGGLDRPNEMQTKVYRKFKGFPRRDLKKICLDIIENRLENPEESAVKMQIGKEIGQKRSDISTERRKELEKMGINPDKARLIVSKPKFEPSPEEDEPMNEPLLPQKKTPKDEIGDYIKQMYEKFKDSNPELADDLQFISDYINSELVDKETLSEIYNLFNKNKLTETKKIRVKLSEVKSFVNKIITETKKPKVIKLKESDIRNIVNNIVNKQKK